MTKRKPAASTADIPPPPATGGTHTWTGTEWLTEATEDASQPSVARVEPDAPPAPPAAPETEA